MTKVSWNRQAILAATLFVFGGGAIYLEYKYKPQREKMDEESKHVFHLKDKQVHSIRFSSAKQAPIQIKCSDLALQLCKPGDQSKWELSEPLQIKADDSNSNALVSTLNHLNSSETIDLKDETPEKRHSLLKEYGIDLSDLSHLPQIEVTTAEGVSVLYLGGNHPIHEGVFAIQEEVSAGQKPSLKPREDLVYLIPQYFKANLERDLTHWRNKKLFTVASHEIERFELENSKGSLTGIKKENQWMIQTRSGELSGDPDQINSLLSSASLLSAKSFVSENKTNEAALSALKGAKKVLTLTLNQEKGTAPQAHAPITLTFFEKLDTERMKKEQQTLKHDSPEVHAQTKGGKKSPPSAHAEKAEQKYFLLYATVSNLDPLFLLDSFNKERLEKGVQDLRLAKLITTMQRFSAHRLEFKGGALKDQSLILTQKQGQWTASHDASELDASQVQKLLDKLSQSKITSFLTGKDIPPGMQGGIQLSLGNEQNAQLRKWVFWKHQDQLYARDLQSQTQEAFLMQKNFADILPQDMNFFKKEEAPAPGKTKEDPKTSSFAHPAPPEDDEESEKHL